jgi:hypothetical protein
MRYVIKKDSPDVYTAPIYELGEIVNGKKRIVFSLEDFLISQLDEEYLDEKLFRIISKMWKAGTSEEEIKDYYKQQFRTKNKELYDQTYAAHINMRKKKSSKSKPKRKITKKCKCK